MAEKSQAGLEGKQPIFIQQKNEETYGLRTGPGSNDCVPFKLLKREEILESVRRLGFMCDFFEAKAALEAYPEEEFLLVFDLTEGCGERWFMCTTPEAKERYMNQGQEEEAQEAAQSLAEAVAAAAREAAEEAERHIVYRDEPIVPQPWRTKTQEATAEEVASMNLAARRPLLGVRIVCPRALVERSILRQERSSEAAVEYRTHKVPPEDFVAKRQGEVAVQAGDARTASATQTTWRRLVNKSTMGTSVGAGDLEPPPPAPVSKLLATDLPKDLAKDLADEEAERKLVSFLDRVAPILEEALQQNEAVDVFSDAFLNHGDDDSGLGAKGENEMKELRTFTDLEYSKNHALSAIDWVPGSAGSLAVSVVKNLNFDERVSISGQVERAYILLWDFGDLIHPQLKLQSPKEVFCFRFNPTQPLMVVAGLLSGQVAMWNLRDSMEQLRERRRRNNRKGLKSAGTKDLGEEEVALPPVDIMALSSIDASHRRMVADLVWLPWNTQINSRGLVLEEEHLVEGRSFQFLTVASDGQLLVWDTRYEAIMSGAMPWLARPRAKTSSTNADGDDDEKKGKILWLPLYRSHLKRLEGVGELSLCRICLAASEALQREGSLPDDTSEEDKQTQFFCATEEGDLVFGDWQPGAATKTPAVGETEEDEAQEITEAVLWTAKDHSRPCVALQRSPFFAETFLSVGDWSFQLWSLGVRKPIFSSPVSDAYLTDGRWSPSRPSVLFVSRIDGSIDVWDFTDTSYRHSIRLNASPSRITSMEFLSKESPARKDAGATRQLLAVGDSGGNLHVFDIPRPISRPIPSERAIMSSFLEKEAARIHAADANASGEGDAEAAREEDPANAGPAREAEIDGPRLEGEAKASDALGMDEDSIDAEDALRVQEEYEALEKEFLAGLEASIPVE